MAADKLALATQFIAQLNSGSIADLLGQYSAIVDDADAYQKNEKIAQAATLLLLIDTIGAIKFGHEWEIAVKRACDD